MKEQMLNILLKYIGNTDKALKARTELCDLFSVMCCLSTAKSTNVNFENTTFSELIAIEEYVNEKLEDLNFYLETHDNKLHDTMIGKPEFNLSNLQKQLILIDKCEKRFLNNT